MSNYLNENLRFLRSLEGWTKTQAAHKCGMSECKWSRLEEGIDELTPLRVRQIAAHTDFPEEFFSHEWKIIPPKDLTAH